MAQEVVWCKIGGLTRSPGEQLHDHTDHAWEIRNGEMGVTAGLGADLFMLSLIHTKYGFPRRILSSCLFTWQWRVQTSSMQTMSIWEPHLLYLRPYEMPLDSYRPFRAWKRCRTLIMCACIVRYWNHLYLGTCSKAFSILSESDLLATTHAIGIPSCWNTCVRASFLQEHISKPCVRTKKNQLWEPAAVFVCLPLTKRGCACFCLLIRRKCESLLLCQKYILQCDYLGWLIKIKLGDRQTLTIHDYHHEPLQQQLDMQNNG